MPRAMAEAFRKGNMGIMDYYNMKNIVSDTDMRSSISKGYDDGPKGYDEPPKPSGPKP